MSTFFENTKKDAPNLYDRIFWHDPQVIERIGERSRLLGDSTMRIANALKDFQKNNPECPLDVVLTGQQDLLGDFAKTIAYFKALMAEYHRIVVTQEHIIIDLETGRIRSSQDYPKKPHLRLVK